MTGRCFYGFREMRMLNVDITVSGNSYFKRTLQVYRNYRPDKR
jgi:hypothetical protein